MKELLTSKVILTAFLFFSLSKSFSQGNNDVFNVKNYGASGEKEQIATSPIQRAIDACFANGGGKVYLPPGNYTTGTIQLRSNITLEVAGGAVWFASKNPKDYNSPGEHAPSLPVLIYGENLKNISLTGAGTIDGQATHTWELLKEPDNFISKETENASKAGIEMKRAYAQAPFVRLIYLTNCKDIKAEDISIINSPNWSFHIEASERILVNKVYISSSLTHGVNADGLDIDGCKDVIISNCTIFTGDDSICLKTTKSSKKPVENVLVTNCLLTSSSCAAKIGTETFYNFSNIRFSNCIIKDTNRAIGIFVRDGAAVKNVTFSNLTVECKRKNFNWWGDGDLFRFVVLKRTDTSKVGSIAGIQIEGINATVEGTSLIESIEKEKISNISLSNINLSLKPESSKDKRSTDAVMIKSVNGLRVKDLKIAWDEAQPQTEWKSALKLNDVNDFQITGFEGRQGLLFGEKAVILLINCSAGLIKNSIAPRGTSTFLEVSGYNSQRLGLLNNYLVNAKRKILINKDVQKGVVTIE